MSRIPFGRHEVEVKGVDRDALIVEFPDGRVVRARVSGPWVEVVG